MLKVKIADHVTLSKWELIKRLHLLLKQHAVLKNKISEQVFVVLLSILWV